MFKKKLMILNKKSIEFYKPYIFFLHLSVKFLVRSQLTVYALKKVKLLNLSETEK